MKKVVTEIYLNCGEKIELEYNPAELIEKFSKDGKIRNEFLEIGSYFINPSNVSMMIYREEESRNIARARSV